MRKAVAESTNRQRSAPPTATEKKRGSPDGADLNVGLGTGMLRASSPVASSRDSDDLPWSAAAFPASGDHEACALAAEAGGQQQLFEPPVGRRR
jgi:hypothetical protein